MNPVLRITTKLIKKEFDKGIKEMEGEAAGVTQALNGGGEATQGLATALKASAGSLAKLAVIIGAIILAVKLIVDAVKNLADNNEEISNKIKGIGIALSNLWQGIVTAVSSLIKPAIQWLVNAIYTLLSYLNAITKAWFSLDLFADKQNKTVKETNKEAKKLKKTLAGFDTANVLSDSSAGGKGAGEEAAKPIELPPVEIPGWVQWIADNKDAVLAFLTGLGIALAGLKLIEFGQALVPIGSFLVANAPLIAGIALIVTGLIWVIQDIIDLINDPTIQKLGQLLMDIAVVLGGIALVIATVAGAAAAVPVAIAAGIALLVGLILKNWDTIKKACLDAWNWINIKVIKPIGDAFKNVWNNISTWAKTAWKNIKNAFATVGSFFGGIWDTIKTKFTDIGQKIGDAVSSAFKTAINAVLKAVDTVINTPIRSINKVLDKINDFPGIKITKLSEIKIPRLAQGGIVNNPGSGVAMGSYIAGEKGAEAVIPLTDDTLQRLANMIPINIDLTNKLDSRIISKQMINVQNDRAFARNGG